MNKIIGYVLCILGLIGFALTFDIVKTTLKITIPTAITSDILTIGAAALIIIGIFLVWKGGSSQPKEVPIYHGKDIVGYRRHSS